MRIPPGAPVDVQEAFREIWQSIDRLLGPNNVDWHGRRIINAGEARAAGDYVTKGELDTVTAPLIEHVADTDNPHDTTAAQTGGMTQAQVLARAAVIG